MRVVLSTTGRFHSFDLARELHSHGALQAIFTGYPRFKLRGEQLPQELIHCFPWVHAPYMGFRQRRLLGRRINQWWEYIDKITLDRHVSLRMPECDVFVGLSGSALRSGMEARRRGAKYVCDRGSSHIRVQDCLLREEHALWGLPFDGVDPRVIDREEAEYAVADCITVPSTFNIQSFVDSGVSPGKMRRVPYGVNLERFHPTSAPDAARFDVLFAGGMSLRKGVPYLLMAYKELRHSRKSLSFAGTPDPTFIDFLKRRALWPEGVRILGHHSQEQLRDVMSRSHVMVLPSIEEGMAMVQAQAMACGCPVIGTDHTGAADLFADSKEGFIVPIREPARIAECLQRLADAPELRAQMSEATLARVNEIGGWHDYGSRALSVYASLIGRDWKE
jgi:glycosyltransferase involved in cell wall biosynthesis